MRSSPPGYRLLSVLVALLAAATVAGAVLLWPARAPGRPPNAGPKDPTKLVDATLTASASVKTDDQARWAGHRRKKPVHGYKAHIATDEAGGLVRSVEITTANVHDAAELEAVLPPEPGDVDGDSAFTGGTAERLIIGRGGRPRTVWIGIWGRGPEALTVPATLLLIAAVAQGALTAVGHALVARLGEQSELVTNASVKRTPSMPIRSMLGVFRIVLPYALMATC